MFSSNQVLKICGPIDKEYISKALKFALEYSGDYKNFTRTENPAKCVYQITEDNVLCIGRAWDRQGDGWNNFLFDFNIDILAEVVINHLSKQEIKDGGWDGSYEKGFVMTAIERSFAAEKDGIKDPYYGIVKFEPFTCFYAK